MLVSEFRLEVGADVEPEGAEEPDKLLRGVREKERYMSSVNETRICVAVSILCNTTAIFYRHPTDFARRGRCPACRPSRGIRGERRDPRTTS
jgi:hypothetical protein